MIRHVSRGVADGEGRRMRKDDRSQGNVERVFHRPQRSVAQIDQHAEPVQLTDDQLKMKRTPLSQRTRSQAVNDAGETAQVGVKSVAENTWSFRRSRTDREIADLYNELDLV